MLLRHHCDQNEKTLKELVKLDCGFVTPATSQFKSPMAAYGFTSECMKDHFSSIPVERDTSPSSAAKKRNCYNS